MPNTARSAMSTASNPTPSTSSSGFFGVAAGFFSGSTSPRGERQAAPTSLRKALGTRGGVVRAQDGFEVFYGVGDDAKAKAKVRQAKAQQQDSRDGFDKFFGIQRSGDGSERVKRVAVTEDSAAADMSHCEEAAATAEQQRQLQAQLQPRLGGSAGNDVQARAAETSGIAADSAGKGSAPAVPPLRIRRATVGGYPTRPGAGRGDDHQVPEGVPTFALDRQSTLPRGVETYSLSGKSAQTPRQITTAAGVRPSSAGYSAAASTPCLMPPKGTIQG
eukprot:TRINITY_DN11182_c0_g2_i2.p1 TRINITY_DN11182_c0_g2~~TRINITY_DN11182_c0_g2_i2.p1  ORF type:complete len:308 (-),score=52.58 TRINITY_DN11182_c0_g2_i2:42-866(-)